VGTPLETDGLKGTFAGLTAEGALQLRLADGSLRTIHAGEVNLAD
jgi:BirA family biotin operon repressor/biotin-[acetyl-CoA-carboxylase] ligase